MVRPSWGDKLHIGFVEAVACMARSTPSDARALAFLSRTATGEGMRTVISTPIRLPPRVKLWLHAALLTFALTNLALLATAALTGSWIVNARSEVIPTDFVSFWSTSRQVQDGPAAQVYDWSAHRAVEADLVGPGHEGQFPWLNPPIFLLAVVPLAFIPYPAAFLGWVMVTLAAYAAALRTVVPSRWVLVGACAFPATLWTASVGQNGFITGALIAGTLGLLDRRPWLAGFLLGLLTCKPQFGILFPFVLMAGGKWRVIGAATITAALLSAVTLMMFGPDTWVAFLASMALSKQAVLTEGRMGLYKMQSPYGAILWMGGDAASAWAVQIITTSATLVAVAWVWRRPTSPEVKSASLGLGALVATPYAFIYDYPILAVPIAFLIRAGISRNTTLGEVILIATASVLIFAFPLVKAPVGPVAACLVAIAVAQRARLEKQLDGSVPSLPSSGTAPGGAS